MKALTDDEVTTLHSLRKARGYIAKGWTQRSSARNAANVPVAPCSKTAVCWCATGALDRAHGHSGWPIDAEIALGEARDKKWRPTLLVAWNDAPRRTQAQVLATFDKAIATLVAKSGQ